MERDEGKLRAAHRSFVECAGSTCPAAIRFDCGQWLSGVEARLPSISVVASDQAGRDVVAVRVSMDGETLATRLDGRAIAVDPGEHEFVFEHGGSEPILKRVLIHDGEKVRTLPITFRERGRPLASEVDIETTRRSGNTSPVVSVVLAGIGVVAAGSYAYFGLNASSDVDRMRASCAPACPSSDVADARRDLLVANVSFVVGVVALGAAVATFVMGGASHR